MKIYNTLLINEELLKSYTPITDNTDISEVIPFVLAAQQMYIEPILGELLYSELQDQIANNDLTEENSALIIKIAPCLGYYAMSESIPFNYIRFTNKGLTSLNSENSTTPAMKDVLILKENASNIAESFKVELVSFLEKCKDKYPSWIGNNERVDITYESKIYFKIKKPLND